MASNNQEEINTLVGSEAPTTDNAAETNEQPASNSSTAAVNQEPEVDDFKVVMDYCTLLAADLTLKIDALDRNANSARNVLAATERVFGSDSEEAAKIRQLLDLTEAAMKQISKNASQAYQEILRRYFLAGNGDSEDESDEDDSDSDEDDSDEDDSDSSDSESSDSDSSDSDSSEDDSSDSDSSDSDSSEDDSSDSDSSEDSSDEDSSDEDNESESESGSDNENESDSDKSSSDSDAEKESEEENA